MKTIFITREFKQNGITYYAGTTLTRPCCEFMAVNERFPSICDVTAWWVSLIQPVNDRISDEVIKVFKKQFGESYVLYCKEYTIL